MQRRQIEEVELFWAELLRKGEAVAQNGEMRIEGQHKRIRGTYFVRRT